MSCPSVAVPAEEYFVISGLSTRKRLPLLGLGGKSFEVSALHFPSVREYLIPRDAVIIRNYLVK